MGPPLFPVNYPLDDGLDKTNQQDDANFPEEGDLGCNPPLQVAPQVRVIPQFHVKHLFQKEAGDVFKNAGHDHPDDKEQEKVVANLVGRN